MCIYKISASQVYGCACFKQGSNFHCALLSLTKLSVSYEPQRRYGGFVGWARTETCGVYSHGITDVLKVSFKRNSSAPLHLNCHLRMVHNIRWNFWHRFNPCIWKCNLNWSLTLEGNSCSAAYLMHQCENFRMVICRFPTHQVTAVKAA